MGGNGMPIEKPAVKSRTIITPNATAIFVYVWEPRESMNEGGIAQYQLSLAFKKTEDITALRRAVKACATDKFGAAGVRLLDKTPPFRQIDDMDTPVPGHKGGVFITAKSKSKPGIVDENRDVILEPMDFYPGCICRASVVPFAYDKKGSKGVTFLLNNIQKLKDGTRLDGKKKAEDEFDDASDDDGNPLDD